MSFMSYRFAMYTKKKKKFTFFLADYFFEGINLLADYLACQARYSIESIFSLNYSSDRMQLLLHPKSYARRDLKQRKQ